MIALAIGSVYAVFDALGWRVFTCVLSGSVHDGVSCEAALLRGYSYAAAYFLYVLAAPILVIAAILRIAVLRR
jgi:hypothetical protein